MGYRARFHPQEWAGGEAVDVAPLDGIDWPLTDVEAAVALDLWHLAGSLDFLRDHPGAPTAVKNWDGPGYVRVIAPDELGVYYLV